MPGGYFVRQYKARYGMSQEPIKVGMIGLGTVGGGVARLLWHEQDRVARRSGRPVELVRVAVLDVDKHRDIEVPAGILTNNIQSIVEDPEITIVLQLMLSLIHI